jgi:hypothetical protein
MIEIIETTQSGHRRVIDTTEDFASAKLLVERLPGGVCFMEDDADYPECADAYMNNGRVLAIQPVGFKAYDVKKAAKVTTHAKTMQDAAAAFDAEFGIGRKA